MAVLSRSLAAVATTPRALAGATGFFTRLPVGATETDWTAFCRQPAAMVAVAYPLGGVLALAVLLPVPAVTVALVLPAWLLVLTGITHLDGLADLGDAAVVHGDPERRRSVMTDTTTGVGALAAVGIAIVGVALAGIALAALEPVEAVAVVVGAEIGAKLAVLVSIGLGSTAHEGLGSAVAEGTGIGSIAAGVVLALPAAIVGGIPVATAIGAGVVTSLVVLTWAKARLGGTSGDVFGATNELARLFGLHAGLTVLSVGAAVGPLGPALVRGGFL